MPVEWNSIDKNTMDQLKSVYERYGKFGDDAFRGDNITLKNADKWLTDAGVIGDKISTTDTGIAFKKVMSNNEKTMSFEKFKEFLGAMTESAYPSNALDELKKLVSKLQARQTPKTTDTTEPIKAEVIERLTDPANYTGTQRFNADGKAVPGHSELPDVKQAKTDGYVEGYKNADTYNKDHPNADKLADAEANKSKEKKDQDNKVNTDAKKDQDNKTNTDAKKDQDNKSSVDAKKDQDNKISTDAKKDQDNKSSVDAKKDQDNKISTDAKKDQENKIATDAKKDQDNKTNIDAKKDGQHQSGVTHPQSTTQQPQKDIQAHGQDNNARLQQQNQSGVNNASQPGTGLNQNLANQNQQTNQSNALHKQSVAGTNHAGQPNSNLNQQHQSNVSNQHHTPTNAQPGKDHNQQNLQHPGAHDSSKTSAQENQNKTGANLSGQTLPGTQNSAVPQSQQHQSDLSKNSTQAGNKADDNKLQSDNSQKTADSLSYKHVDSTQRSLDTDKSGANTHANIHDRSQDRNNANYDPQAKFDPTKANLADTSARKNTTQLDQLQNKNAAGHNLLSNAQQAGQADHKSTDLSGQNNNLSSNANNSGVQSTQVSGENKQAGQTGASENKNLPSTTQDPKGNLANKPLDATKNTHDASKTAADSKVSDPQDKNQAHHTTTTLKVEETTKAPRDKEMKSEHDKSSAGRTDANQVNQGRIDQTNRANEQAQSNLAQQQTKDSAKTEVKTTLNQTTEKK